MACMESGQNLHLADELMGKTRSFRYRLASRRDRKFAVQGFCWKQPTIFSYPQAVRFNLLIVSEPLTVTKVMQDMRLP